MKSKIQANFQAVKCLTNLECQLFCLEKGYPVRCYEYYDSYYNTEFESKSWLKSSIVRGAFYTLASHTDSVIALEKMKSWLTAYDDAAIDRDAKIAIKNVIIKIKNRKEKEHDRKPDH